jgi:hypothetical protein
MALMIASVAVIALVVFLLWRYTSVARGARSRDKALLARLDPLAERFQNEEPVTPEEIQILAACPELHTMLYMMLSHYQRLDLFPSAYLSNEAQAEAVLVYWMLHPNELQAAPATIQLEEKLQRELEGKQGDFYVFRYKLPVGHWAGPEWHLGLAGPFFPEDLPYQGVAGCFSRAGDVPGPVAPAELVDWYINMFRRNGVAEPEVAVGPPSSSL